MIKNSVILYRHTQVSPVIQNKNKIVISDSSYRSVRYRFSVFLLLCPPQKQKLANTTQKSAFVSFNACASFFLFFFLYVLHLRHHLLVRLLLFLLYYTLLDLCISATITTTIHPTSYSFIHSFIHSCAFLFASGYQATNRNNK